MTQERQPKTDNRIRNTALVGGVLTLTALAYGVGGALAPRETAKGTYSPSPTAGELATPRPSEAAGTPSPEGSRSPEVNIQNFTVEKLGTFEVLPGDIISGDVAMSNTKDSAIFPLYDQDTWKAADVSDNTKTALYIDVQTPGVVYAEWGATVTRGLTPEKKAEMLKLQAISKQRAGFEKVDVVLWTGYDTTVDQAGYKANNEQASVTSEQIPSDTDGNKTGYNLENLSNQDKIRTILNLFATGKVNPDSQEGQVLLDVIANCLCACQSKEKPKVSEPVPSKKPEPTPAACPPSINDYFMKPGETYTVAEGVDFIVQGDVIIDGKRTYDNSAKTGAISIVTDQKANKIKAPWGADVQQVKCPTDQFIKETFNNDLQQLKATGRSLDKNSINQLK